MLNFKFDSPYKIVFFFVCILLWQYNHIIVVVMFHNSIILFVENKNLLFYNYFLILYLYYFPIGIIFYPKDFPVFPAAFVREWIMVADISMFQLENQFLSKENLNFSQPILSTPNEVHWKRGKLLASFFSPPSGDCYRNCYFNSVFTFHNYNLFVEILSSVFFCKFFFSFSSRVIFFVSHPPGILYPVPSIIPAFRAGYLFFFKRFFEHDSAFNIPGPYQCLRSLKPFFIVTPVPLLFSTLW